MAVDPYPLAEEKLNAAIHGFGAVFGAIGLVLLTLQVQQVGRPGSLPAITIYGAALILLFTFSALHHAVQNARFKQIFLALDHGGIYLLIAGSYTPFCLLLPSNEQGELLALVWGLALTGIAVQTVAFAVGRSDSYERGAFTYYLVLGWVPILWAGDKIYSRLASAGLNLLFAGGVAFSIGVIFYLWKSLPYGHAIWHLFVVIACALQFFAIYYYVVPLNP